MALAAIVRAVQIPRLTRQRRIGRAEERNAAISLALGVTADRVAHDEAGDDRSDHRQYHRLATLHGGGRCVSASSRRCRSRLSICAVSTSRQCRYSAGVILSLSDSVNTRYLMSSLNCSLRHAQRIPKRLTTIIEAPTTSQR